MSAVSLLYFSDATLVLGINVLWQITIIMVIALAFAAITRRSPAMRYWVLCWSLLLILISPMAAIFQHSIGGGWLSIALITDISDQEINLLAVDGENALIQTTPPIAELSKGSTDAEGILITTTMLPDFRKAMDRASLNQRESSMSDRGIDQTNNSGNLLLADVQQDETAIDSVPQRMPTRVGIALRAIGPPLLSIWLAGTSLLLLRLGVGWWRLVAILRSAHTNTDHSLTQAFLEVGDALGIRKQASHGTRSLARLPALVLSDRVTGPFAAGIWRPHVVLPTRMVKSITAKQLRDILIHEMAHLVRRDQVVVLLQNLVGAIFWLHPLIRNLNRQLAQSREEVCDNYVLAATDAPSYSQTLLTLAKLVHTPSSLPGTIGLFTSRWKLEQRVAGLLDSRRNCMTKMPVGSRFVVGLSMLCVVGLSSVLTMKLVVAQSNGGERNRTDQTDKQLTITQAGGAVQTPPIRATVVFKGQVINENADPVSNAYLVYQENYSEELIESTSDDEGRFEIEIPIQSEDPTPFLWILADGYAVRCISAKANGKEHVARLELASTLSYIITSPDRKPIADATVEPYYFSLPNGVESADEPTGLSGPIPAPLLAKIRVQSSIEGKVTFSQLPPKLVRSIKVTTAEFGEQTFESSQRPSRAVRTPTPVIEVPAEHSEPLRLQLGRVGSLEGVFITEHPETLQGLRLNVETTQQGHVSRGVANPRHGMASTQLDEYGRFNIANILEGDGDIRLKWPDSAFGRPLIPMFKVSTKGTRLAIVVFPTTEIRVRILTSDTLEPVNGAWVSIRDVGGRYSSQRLVTDGDGYYKGRAIPGEVKIHIVYMPGIVDYSHPRIPDVRVPSSQSIFKVDDILLPRLAEISGRLLGADGQPVAARHIMLSQGRFPLTHARSVTDERGEFTCKTDTLENLKYVDFWRMIPIGKDFETMKEEELIPLTVTSEDPLILRMPVSKSTRLP